MKTAIYIEDGIVQLVLTPESEFEKEAMSSFHGKELTAKMFSGSFYDCRGGWVRQREYYASNEVYGRPKDDESLIVRVNAQVKGDQA